MENTPLNNFIDDFIKEDLSEGVYESSTPASRPTPPATCISATARRCGLISAQPKDSGAYAILEWTTPTPQRKMSSMSTP